MFRHFCCNDCGTGRRPAPSLSAFWAGTGLDELALLALPDLLAFETLPPFAIPGESSRSIDFAALVGTSPPLKIRRTVVWDIPVTSAM